ncbi:glutathione S-transferase F11-like [Cynara cardunculus var. scolymus]|uniref:glutathione S-transferase F11-like n=1 Tax=Cynara cardunculus var. scolymus TaxID=59895 RepID=UPI000D62C8F2|nr:glutathione S-transferase F11-like [Cynara cardunculus var. scolymus]
MVVKVYGSIRAACPQRVLACLLEFGVDFELINVDLDSNEHKQPEFLQKQPFGQVPVIEDGDFRLFESRAIMRYYARKYADRNPKLYGTTLDEKALVDQWLEVEAHHFNDMVYTIVLQKLVIPKMGGKPDLALVQNCEKKLEKVFDIYEQQLSKNRYLAGDCFTLADLSHLPGIRYLINEAELGHMVKEKKNVNSWWCDISNRVAWKKVMQLME